MSESLRVPLSAIDIQRRPTNYVVAPTKEDVPVTWDELMGISSPIEDEEYLFEDSTHYVVAEEIKENESNEHTFAFYYPVEAEIERLEKERAKGKTKNEVEDLVKNNLTKALEEFAGKVSLTKIPFAWENNTMISPGMSTPMSEMLRELAEKTDDKRLHADAEGFMAIEQAFAQGSNVAFLVSPPSLGAEGFGTYGFFNVFVKKNGKIAEYILRYEGESEGLPLSNTLQRELIDRLTLYDKGNILPASHEDSADETTFLKTPLTVTIDEPERIVSELLVDIGFTEGAHLEEESIFLQAIESDPLIPVWMKEYSDIVIGLIDLPEGPLKDKQKIVAEHKRDAAYNRAVKIKQDIDSKTQSNLDIGYGHEIDLRSNLDIEAAYQYYSSREATVRGGGSCPRADTNGPRSSFIGLEGLSGAQGMFAIADFLTGGTSESYIFDKEGTCKKCNEKSSKVGKLGPCYVCKNCQAKFDSGEFDS